MDADDFFAEIEHTEVSWRQHELHVPVFYQDIRLMSVSILAPIERVAAILPSERC